MSTKLAEDPSFDIQVNAVALTAEINLLLDFISGRADRSLGGGQQLRLPGGYKDYEDMLGKFFDIRGRMSQSLVDPNAKDEVPHG